MFKILKFDSFMNESNKEIIVDKSNNHLKSLIFDEIDKNGPNVDLNHIDVSNITNMSRLFNYIKKFNGDISKWNTFNVRNMTNMFNNSKIESGNMPSIFNGRHYHIIDELVYDNEIYNSEEVTNSQLEHLFKNNDDYYFIKYKGLYFKCDGEDGINEFIKNWNIQ